MISSKGLHKLDLSQAYLQVLLDEKLISYCVMNSHQGLYQCKRLPFEIASAPALFQKLMDSVLMGIPDVICYLNDILIGSKDGMSHLKIFEEVLTRLENRGFCMKEAKC